MTNKIKANVWCYFADKEFEVPQVCVDACSHSGSVDDDVAYWQPKIALNYWTRAEIIEKLQEYGAWNKKELEGLNDNELKCKVLWLACCDAKERQFEENDQS